MNINRFCAALICLLLFSTVSGQGSNAIRSRMQSLVDQGAIPGAVTLVIKKERVISFEAVGYRDIESKSPMTLDTIFDKRRFRRLDDGRFWRLNDGRRAREAGGSIKPSMKPGRVKR